VANPLSLEASELAHLVFCEPRRLDESEQVPVQIGLLANHYVRADFALVLREDEAVIGDDELANRRIAEVLFLDVADDRCHLPGHCGEAIGTQLLDQSVPHDPEPLIASLISGRSHSSRPRRGRHRVHTRRSIAV
jgi:hypothetical protein